MQKYLEENRDMYYTLAKNEGFRARSAYKLLQLNDVLHFLDGGCDAAQGESSETCSVQCAVDLCAAPGSWTQVLHRFLPATAKIVSVDLAPMAPVGSNVNIVLGDITLPETAAEVIGHFGNRLADLVICDGAPGVTGIHDFDEFVQAELIAAAMQITERVLILGGTFIAKVFTGQLTQTILLEKLAYFFNHVQLLKPHSSRSGSAEAFVCCSGFFGQGGHETPGKITYELQKLPRDENKYHL